MCSVRTFLRSLRLVSAAAVLLWAGALPVFATLLIAEPGGPDQELYSQGRSLIFEESWSEARKVFDTLARRHPESDYLDDALYWSAFSLFEQDDPSPAYLTLGRLIRDFPDSPWQVDAKALMVRCAELALKQQGSGGPRLRIASATEYRRFLEESTRDRNAQVSLLAIDTLLNREPQNAPELLGRVRSTGSEEGAEVLLDRFFGRERVKVSFEDRSAGFAEGNVTVLVRVRNQGISLTLPEALDAVAGRGSRVFSDDVRREIRDSILEAERSLVREGPIREPDATRAGSTRQSTIVRVVDGEVHYYENGAERVKIAVLNRSAGFTGENIHIFVERAGVPKKIRLGDVTGERTGPTARGISADTLLYLTQSLGVIELDLAGRSR
jgi:hypothetical protein